MPSSIALGCNGCEAHMQQILTPYGVWVVTGDHDFCLQKPPESSKTERKTQNHLSFHECFWKCLAVSEEIREFSKRKHLQCWESALTVDTHIVNTTDIWYNNYSQNEIKNLAVINPDSILITTAIRGYIIQTIQTIRRIYTPQHIFPKQIQLSLVEYE